MRDLPSGLSAKLAKPVQVKATDADPRLEAWLSRSTTQLVANTALFLEKKTVATSATVTAADIAVKRPYKGGTDRKIYIAYIDNGKAKVTSAAYKINMADHVFTDSGFEEDADDVAICFDGTMPLNRDGAEFVTDREPWVFWTDEGVLYGQVLNANMQPVTLATANCTKVTAVRAPWALGAANDYGLCIFFLLSGAIYYRQYIGGEWKDAEAVSFGPTATWADIAATRTWDYRVCLQCKDTSGNIYDFFTKYFGLGNQINEHIELAGIDANGNLIEIERHDAQSGAEHIELSSVTGAGSLLYGLSASPVSARNVKDASDNWGTTVIVEMDYPVSAGLASEFVLKDSNNTQYAVSAISISGKNITLTCADFNMAGLASSLSVIYTQGTLMSPAVLADSFSISFVPTGLVPPVQPVPEVVSARSTKSDGTQIAVEFTQRVTSDLTSAASSFSVVDSEYDFVPGGTLSSTTHTVTSVATDATINTAVSLSGGTLVDTDASSGSLTLAIDE